MLWAAGFLFFALQPLAGSLRLRGILERSRPVGDPALTAPWAELTALLGLRTHIPLSTSTEVTVPFVTGDLRPIVILPEAALHWPAPMLRAALIHELAHIRRDDLLSAAFAHTVASVYWFHPLAWTSLRALQAEAEMAADDCVVVTEAQPVVYAESLIALVRLFRRSAGATFPAIGMLRGSGVEARIERILDFHCRRSVPRPWARRAALAGVTLLTAGFLVIRPVATLPLLASDDFPKSKAATPSPFDPAPFRLESGVHPAAPPLLEIPSGKREAGKPLFSIPPGQKPGIRSPVSINGMRLDMPIGPVRIDYGTPLRRSYTIPAEHSPQGDFPGPGYREQKATYDPLTPSSQMDQSPELKFLR